jgi:hypothetical protein
MKRSKPTKKGKNKRINRKLRTRSTYKKQKGGGCEESEEPKCGLEGCVYFDAENVTKIVIEHEDRIGLLLEQINKQKKAHTHVPSLAPNVLSTHISRCNKINIHSKDSPCYVKRGIDGNSVYYIEQNDPSWCVGYSNPAGKKFKGYSLSPDSDCTIPTQSYDHMITRYTKSYKLPGPAEYRFDDYYSHLDADDDDKSKDVFDKMEDTIPPGIINYRPLYTMTIVSERVFGITINDLYEQINSKNPATFQAAMGRIGPQWSDELNQLDIELKKIGIVLTDLNESNVMIDTKDKTLCAFIKQQIEEGVDITPTLIKSHFKIPSILKVIDWGL